MAPYLEEDFLGHPISFLTVHFRGSSTLYRSNLINPYQVDAFDVKPGALSIMTAGSVQILESKFSTGKCLQCCEDPFLTGKSTFSKCKNGQCIKSDLFCDGYKNCEDGSDEVGYDIAIRGFPLDFMGSFVLGKFSCKN